MTAGVHPQLTARSHNRPLKQLETAAFLQSEREEDLFAGEELFVETADGFKTPPGRKQESAGTQLCDRKIKERENLDEEVPPKGDVTLGDHTPATTGAARGQGIQR